MNKRLEQIIGNIPDNYILPFVWLHGADESILRDLMEKIYACGIRAVCLESRPHPDFAGERWWHDVDIIMEEAERRNMRVWVLDDAHFPTGEANGAVKNAPPCLKRWSLAQRHIDIKGPVSGLKYSVSHNLSYDQATQVCRPDYYQEELVAALLGKAVKSCDMTVYQDIRDITGELVDGWLIADLPEGDYRVFILTKKLNAAFMQKDAVSMLEKDSVRILIDAVYEPHFKRYGKHFGGTFAGFFSDEPGFFNLENVGYGAVDRIGCNMPLPWTDGVLQELSEQFGDGVLTKLPSLFGNCSEGDKEIRFAYMDIVTRKYQENFSGQLGEWCASHSVEYIGHVVEDVITYGRLGPGTGHFFRAISGQHMAGIDIVLQNLMPDDDESYRMFSHYGLTQLAVSAARQNPWQKGRAICELFGAYGWAEGITMMKWMADILIAGGINYFVPHAFTDNPFPDPDCPPHFYAQGNNPQYPYLKHLFNYMNRMGHLLNGGTARIDTALFFDGDLDWVGDIERYFVPAKTLVSNQINYDLLCFDALKCSRVEDGKIIVGNIAYARLFIGKASYMPDVYAQIISETADHCAKVYFIGEKPKGLRGEHLSCLDGIPSVTKAEMLALAQQTASIKTDIPQKWLRFFHYEHSDMTVYMFFNASLRSEILTTVTFTDDPPGVRYDVLTQKLQHVERLGERSVTLRLAPGESAVYLAGEGTTELARNVEVETPCEHAVTYNGGYMVSYADYHEPSVYKNQEHMDALVDISRIHPRFAGKIRYEFSISNQGYRKLSLTGGNEAVDVFVNGEYAGARICAPYMFDIENHMRDGENRIRIELATTLVNAVPDAISCRVPVGPTGLTGQAQFLV